MNWRTDIPTAELIVAKLTNHSYEVPHRESGYYFDFVEDDVPLDSIEKWADLEEGETVTDCNKYSTVEEELDAFIKCGKAIKEENCGTYTTTYIDPLKVARHFAKWGAEHLKNKQK